MTDRGRPTAIRRRTNEFLERYRTLLGGGAVLVATVGLLLLGGDRSDRLSTDDSSSRDGLRSLGPQATIDGSSDSVAGQGALEAGASKGRSDRIIKVGGISLRIPDSGGPPVADLYAAAEDTRGITNSEIRLCGHGPWVLSSLLGITEESVNTYWDYVNEELGGIYGRRVLVRYADDNAGQGTGVRDAYEDCKAFDSFFIGGPPIIDVVPAMRALVEQDHGMYFHDTAREDLAKRYSFSLNPSLEVLGVRVCQWVISQHPGKRIGVIWRDSEHWKPGYFAMRDCFQAAGVTIDRAASTTGNETLYTTHIQEVDDTEVVILVEDALADIKIIQQASSQQFNPSWVLILPTNLVTETLEESQTFDDPTSLEGISTWLPYLPGVRDAGGEYAQGKKDGSFAAYADLITEYERQHKKYARDDSDQEVDRSDLSFYVWLNGWSKTHQLLVACGKDCTRNRFLGLLLSGVHSFDPRLCPLDFRANGHVGSTFVNIHRGFEAQDGRYGWENVASCKDGF